MNKNFITSQSLLQDSFRLAAKVYEDGFRPDFIIGIWRGGAPVSYTHLTLPTNREV